MFQNQILELKQTNINLQNITDQLQQHDRRLCIRIDGIQEVSKKSSEDVFNKIVDMLMKTGIEDDEQNFDRAHRIWKSYHHKKKKMCKSKIMNFLFRSDVERQKKNLDDGLIVHADLTKNRQSLLR